MGACAYHETVDPLQGLLALPMMVMFHQSRLFEAHEPLAAGQRSSRQRYLSLLELDGGCKDVVIARRHFVDIHGWKTILVPYEVVDCEALRHCRTIIVNTHGIRDPLYLVDYMTGKGNRRRNALATLGYFLPSGLPRYARTTAFDISDMVVPSPSM